MTQIGSCWFKNAAKKLNEHEVAYSNRVNHRLTFV